MDRRRDFSRTAPCETLHARADHERRRAIHKHLNAATQRRHTSRAATARRAQPSRTADAIDRHRTLRRPRRRRRDRARSARRKRSPQSSTRLEERLAQHRLSRKSSQLGWLFAKSTPQAGPIRGLYIHGDVGRGKTMLMDLFFAASAVKRKRRVHFHEFMADVHERLNAVRQEMKAGRDRRRRSDRATSRPRWPRKPGCSASTNFTSPTSPTR